MASPEDLIQTATAAGAQIKRKPAWQQLRDQGIGGQGSAAANKAKLASTTTSPAFGGTTTTQPGRFMPGGPDYSQWIGDPGYSGGRGNVSSMRPLRIGGFGAGASPPIVAPPPGVDAGTMDSAFRPFRMGGAPSGTESIRQPMMPGEPPMKPDLPPAGGGFNSPDWAPSIGDPNGGKPMMNAAPPEPNQSPPWAGMAGLMAGTNTMTKPLAPPPAPGGGLQSFAPEEPPNVPGGRALGPNFPKPRLRPGMGGADTAY